MIDANWHAAIQPITANLNSTKEWCRERFGPYIRTTGNWDLIYTHDELGELAFEWRFRHAEDYALFVLTWGDVS